MIEHIIYYFIETVELENIMNYNTLKDIGLPLLNIVAVALIFILQDVFRRNEIKMNRKYESINNRPIFVFVENELDFFQSEGDTNIFDIRWKYPDDKYVKHSSKVYKQDEVDERVETIFNKSYLRFKNVGDGVAYNIKMVVHHIDSVKYYEYLEIKEFQVGKFIHKIEKKNKKDEYNNDFLYSYKDQYSDREIMRRYTFNIGNNHSKLHRRIVAHNDTFSIRFNDSDRSIINYSLFNMQSNIKPFIKVELNYEDKHGNKFKDVIYIAIVRDSMRDVLSVQTEILASLGEVDPYYIDEYSHFINQ
ncbi:hypothetical protein [Macrococcoides bohemicum]|uniref:hypothetical protein n=1 Tax=Macrococcoides bohemicum TaxID=1903056 RepID=UPI00193FDCB5|nr:hypothetical protein [Macrococcus bohemicus]QRN49966.1 hypothetical protein HT586_07110 [Macrococcus bohemicus]